MSYPQSSDPRAFDAFFNYARKMFARASGVRVEGAIGTTVEAIVPGELVTAEPEVFLTSATMSNGVGGVYFNHSSTEATFTYTMPANPEDMQEVLIASRSIITTLTHDANAGQTIRGALTTIAANGFARYQYRATGTVWTRVG